LHAEAKQFEYDQIKGLNFTFKALAMNHWDKQIKWF